MLSELEARAEAIGRARAGTLVEQLAQRLVAVAPGLHVEADADSVTVTGRGVTGDPRLVWIGSILR